MVCSRAGQQCLRPCAAQRSGCNHLVGSLEKFKERAVRRTGGGDSTIKYDSSMLPIEMRARSAHDQRDTLFSSVGVYSVLTVFIKE